MPLETAVKLAELLRCEITDLYEKIIFYIYKIILRKTLYIYKV